MITEKRYLRAKKVVEEYERQLKNPSVPGRRFNIVRSDLEFVGIPTKCSIHIKKIKNGQLLLADFDQISEKIRDADLLIYDLHTNEYGILVIGLNRNVSIIEHADLILEILNSLK